MKTRDIVIIIAVVVVVALGLGLGLGLGLKKGTHGGCCDLSQMNSCNKKCDDDYDTCMIKAGKHSDKQGKCRQTQMECSKKCIGCNCICFSGSFENGNRTIDARCYTDAFKSDTGLKNCCDIKDYNQYRMCVVNAKVPSANC
jgi:hypothetical protein